MYFLRDVEECILDSPVAACCQGIVVSLFVKLYAGTSQET